MKRCPQCRKDYLDDSLLYCLDDGAALVQGSVTDEPRTAILSGRDSDEAATRHLNAGGTGRVTVSLPAFFSSTRLPWIVAGILLAAVLVGGWMFYRRAAPTSGPLAYSFSIAPPQDMTFTESLAISPDGRRIAFTARPNGGDTVLWVRSLDNIEPIKLSGTEGARFPFWSPDSKYIGYFAGNKLKKIDANGGPSQVIADANAEPRGAAWGSDGTILFSPLTNTPVMRVNATGGSVSEVTQLDTSHGETSHRWPVFLPDGRHFLYFNRGNRADGEGVTVGSLDGGEKKLLFNSRVMATFVPPGNGTGHGHLLFERDGSLLAQEFDVDKLALVGDAFLVASTVQAYPTEAGPTALSVVSASNNGILIFRPGSAAITHLRWADRKGELSEPLVQPGIYHEPLLSPDGKRLAVSVEEQGKGGQDVWVLEFTRNVLTRLTFDAASDGSPLWSPDGSTIYFASNRTGRFGIYKKPSTGVGTDEAVYVDDANDLFPDSISPDGRWMLVDQGGRAAGRPSLIVLDLTAQSPAQPLSISPGAAQHAQFSPDGKWISYSSDESGRVEVYVEPFPAKGGKWQISTGGGDQSLWNRNGKEIVYLTPDRFLMSVAVNPGTAFEVGQATRLFATDIPASGLTDERANYFIAADGQRFMLNRLVEGSSNTPLTVLINWETALKRQ